MSQLCVGGHPELLKISYGTGLNNRANAVVRDHETKGDMPKDRGDWKGLRTLWPEMFKAREGQRHFRESECDRGGN